MVMGDRVSMKYSEIRGYLSSIAPFNTLGQELLDEVAAQSDVTIYPAGHAILVQDGMPSDHLQVIRKGRVKVYLRSQTGEEVVIDHRGEGDCFGLVSLLGGTRSRSNVIAEEETVCIRIRKEIVVRLMESNPVFAEFFRSSLFDRLIDRAYGEIYRRNALYGSSDKLFFGTPLRELVMRDLVTAPQNMSIRDAAARMSEKSVSSLVLIDDNTRPAGIITDRDLRDKVVSKERDLHEPVRNIMSVALITADGADLCFEAVLKMIKCRVHHILIVDRGSLKGIITDHDLITLQGASPLSLAKEIEDQQTIEGLVGVSERITNLVGLLLKGGEKASTIARMIAALNDRLFIKILQIAEEEVGATPVRYCWIVFGSEGRKEQTFRTDQDNAIIYEDVSDPVEEGNARRYFSRMTKLVSGYLEQCAFPPCPGGYMASNPLWCQPLSVWKRYFSQWIHEPNGEAVLRSLIFFDFRHLYGDMSLSEKLGDSLESLLEGMESFLGFMANMIVKNAPPLSVFNKIVAEKSSEYKNTVDIKIKGLASLVDAVRLFSLEKGVRETSTLERIEVLRNVHTIVDDLADDMKDAFELMMMLRMKHQAEQVAAGRTPDNRINLKKLSIREKKMLTEAFMLIADIQAVIIQRYKPFIL